MDRIAARTKTASAIVADADVLSHRVDIYVPCNNGYSTADHVARSLCAVFGGATAQDVKGYWLDAKGALVKDDIVLVYAHCTAKDLEKNRVYVKALCHKVKIDEAQQSVAYAVDTSMFFV